MAQTLREIMTDPRTCRADRTVDEAAKIMRDEDIGDVIVLDDSGKACGIVTDRDITIRAVAEGRDPSTVRLSDVCSHEIVTAAPDTHAEEAARIMRERAVRRLLVTDDGEPLGVVSIGDLAIERDPDSALADISAAPGNQ